MSSTEGSRGRTIIDKIWEAHAIAQGEDAPELLYIDLHFVHVLLKT